ncbi:hypothetical protein DES42_105389 [Zavarzinia compransoris]|uniref:Uncharacterized protein n=1 Tax=Zavarzinia compransoris TaxID=1264899 RepID=A0A317E3I6_9PROT|nr:hypothetical protein DKG75_05960 [Zavarzinia compransoris]TDP45682.1 hypothetical protein DES42_105389 [Zavarzinia compransoris]
MLTIVAVTASLAGLAAGRFLSCKAWVALTLVIGGMLPLAEIACGASALSMTVRAGVAIAMFQLSALLITAMTHNQTATAVRG